jgi:hypothetical protein
MSQAQKTRNHETIQRWVEERNGHPATVKGTEGKEDAGLLRIDFPGGAGKESLQQISWDDFFEKFDEEEIEFLYQDTTENGKTSRFCKFVRS